MENMNNQTLLEIDSSKATVLPPLVVGDQFSYEPWDTIDVITLELQPHQALDKAFQMVRAESFRSTPEEVLQSLVDTIPKTYLATWRNERMISLMWVECQDLARTYYQKIVDL